jgi:hypothetical protein
MTKARDLANASTALSAVDATELGYLNNVTSAIQTQMDAKASLTGTETLTNKTLTNPVIASVINNTLTSTTGDIIYASAANTPARLGIGTTDQVLKVTAGVPAWGAAPAASHIGVRVKGSSNQTIANTTFTILPFNQETYDTSNFHDTSTNNSRLTIPSGLSGYYYVYANLNWNGSTSGYRRQQIYKNGSTSAFEVDIAFSQDIWMNVHSSTTLYLSATDYLEMRVYQTSGGSRSIHMGETVGDLTHFGLAYLGA